MLLIDFATHLVLHYLLYDTLPLYCLLVHNGASLSKLHTS